MSQKFSNPNTSSSRYQKLLKTLLNGKKSSLYPTTFFCWLSKTVKFVIQFSFIENGSTLLLLSHLITAKLKLNVQSQRLILET